MPRRRRGRGRQPRPHRRGTSGDEVRHVVVPDADPVALEGESDRSRQARSRAAADAGLARRPAGRGLDGAAAAGAAGGSLDARESSWPELSEYSCFACHHDLESDSWRQDRGFWQPAADANEFHYAKQGNTRVQLAWGNWTLESLGRVGEAFESEASKTFVTSFAALSRTLSSGLQAKAETVQAEARTAAEDLDRWIESLQSTTDVEIRKTLRNVLAEKSGDETNTAWSVGTWDRAAILVLGLTAPYRSVPDKAPEPLKDVLQRIRFTNDAETVFDSPIHFRGPVGASEPEKASERERIRRLIEELVKADG